MLFSIHFIIFECRQTNYCIFLNAAWWMIDHFKHCDAKIGQAKIFHISALNLARNVLNKWFLLLQKVQNTKLIPKFLEIAWFLLKHRFHHFQPQWFNYIEIGWKLSSASDLHMMCRKEDRLSKTFLRLRNLADD